MQKAQADKRRRESQSNKMKASQEVRNQIRRDAATSPERSDKIAAIKVEIDKVVKQILSIENQIPSRPFARQMWIAANTNGLWKKRNDLHKKRKELTKKMVSLI